MEKQQQDRPLEKVSIGMPVFNGERFVKDAIESILKQTYADFELVISDNGSTDKTIEICEAYAKKDSRIKFYKQPENLGAAFNFNFVAQQSRGEFFKWMACDDLIEKNYLELTVPALENDKEAILVYTGIKHIDHEGKFVSRHRVVVDYGNPLAHKRYASHMSDSLVYWEVFGLMRREYLMKTPGLRVCQTSDGILMGELSLMGRFIEVPDELFLNRGHMERSVSTCQSQKDWNLWFDPSANVLPPPLIYFHNPYLRIKTIVMSNLSIKEKVLTLKSLFLGAKYKVYFKKLGDEISSFVRRRFDREEVH